MTETEKAFLEHIGGVKGYIDGVKDRDPGYIYDNISEFKELAEEATTLGTENGEILEIMAFLKKDIDKTIQRQEEPVRSGDEESFYKHIRGINSYISETKQTDPNYIFDNVKEADELLTRLEKLKTEDSNILAIINNITKDIKKTIYKRKGEEATNNYQKRLDSLGINKNDIKTNIKK